MKILFTQRAANAYASIKKYIEEEWGEKTAAGFEQKTIDFLDLLIEYPEIGIIEVPDIQIRAFQLTRHTRVFYRIKREQIIILTLFDSRQDPQKKPK